MRKFAGYKEEVKLASPQLPVGSYVVNIVNAKEVMGENGNGDRIEFQIDIAEGEQKDFFFNLYKDDTSEDKKFKGRASIWYPKDDGTPDDQKTIRSFNAFCAHLAEENDGFHFNFDKDVSQFKGKKIGATFREEWNKGDDGREFFYTAFAWFCSAKDVREGKATAAKTKYRNGATGKVYDGTNTTGTNAGFLSIPAGAGDEIPF